MARKSQSLAWDRLQESLKDLHNLQDKMRVDRDRLRYLDVIAKCLLLNDYLKGDLSVVLDVRAPLESDAIRRLLGGGVSEAFSGIPSLIFQLNVHNRSISEQRNQEAMFVNTVEIVKGPNGIIPSIIRLYFGHYQSEQVGGGCVYFSPLERHFKLIGSWVDGKFGKLAEGRRNQAFNCVHPGVIKGTLEVMEYQGDVGKGCSIAEAALEDTISRCWVYLDQAEFRFFQPKNAGFNIRDVLIGPFDLESG